ncbi:class F sortase [Kitasatospora sp. NPDC057223]|uniref:class F sortase n=1 Tax=Kitasatospora sp. NPDC057223 TaxID=3346055 RepID=UPI00362FC718
MADRTPGREGIPGLLRVGMAAAAVGCLLLYSSVDASPAPTPAPAPPAVAAAVSAAGASPAPAAPAPAAEPAKPAKPAAPVLARSAPTRLRIPQIAVNAPFTELTLDANGALNAPAQDNKNLVGWYRGGPTPGERGSAVVAGHVDTRTGPAVFLLLRMLLPGNKIEVTRADGTIAVFSVDSVRTFPKDAFPDDLVYGRTSDAQLRLITCGGSYDKKRKDYLDNVVVFAHLESSRKA